MASIELIKAIAVTSELMGNVMSPEAAKVFCSDLESYPENHVIDALKLCRQEVKGRLTLADVISRIDFGHVGAEEAWSLCPKTEAETVVWTPEIADAYFTALPILQDGDRIAARMTFLEKYKTNKAKAIRENRSAKWTPSLGWDLQGRTTALEKAHDLGRLPKPEEMPMLHGPSTDPAKMINALALKLKSKAMSNAPTTKQAESP